jgi:phage anti-repressor protein
LFLLKQIFIFVLLIKLTVMEPTVYVSKKGTKVVLASALYQFLELPAKQYSKTIRHWLLDYYQFSDGIRRPVRMQEYAVCNARCKNEQTDYYLSLFFAKQIVLHSASKTKMKVGRWIEMQVRGETPEGMFTARQFAHLVELTKAMRRISCQEASEREHLKRYKILNGGTAAHWWDYRAKLLGYAPAELRTRLRRKSTIEKGGCTDLHFPHPDSNMIELIRAGIIDLFMAIGKTDRFACQMGDLAATLAKEMQLTLLDDKDGTDLLNSVQNEEPELIRRVKEAAARDSVAA